jgi:hypothetical protein
MANEAGESRLNRVKKCLYAMRGGRIKSASSVAWQRFGHSRLGHFYFRYRGGHMRTMGFWGVVLLVGVLAGAERVNLV